MPFDYVLELKNSWVLRLRTGCDFGRWGCRVMRWGGGWWVVVSQQQREIKGEGERVWVVVEMGLGLNFCYFEANLKKLKQATRFSFSFRRMVLRSWSETTSTKMAGAQILLANACYG
ncbi:unnamed protein product [Prunus armeniaca]